MTQRCCHIECDREATHVLAGHVPDLESYACADHVEDIRGQDEGVWRLSDGVCVRPLQGGDDVGFRALMGFLRRWVQGLECASIEEPFHLVWSPTGPYPPRVRMRSYDEAKSAAASMAARYPGQEFFIVTASARFVVPRPAPRPTPRPTPDNDVFDDDDLPF